MKNCTDCKYAEWKRTEAGRLHPDGSGLCKYPWQMPALPASFYWTGFSQPKPNGGHINRRVEYKDHCAYYAR